ncbi:OsmC family protein [Rhizobium sp. LjRoot98]|uniref:OsmC family protein n=1 Tax=unclassified Rhizobium TaxID=2613769 RepID=UPI0007158B55|nr:MULTISPECIES: OsmC family protein [unclassified Rhizobium]KQV42345.1 ABC transporter ATP-binding protein [Rhizobium sp. Root1204]KQY18237.1 ABC transporter ATP-binding protein [Rhizobium sp. Root1334]KRB98538.1 ABC transporter ATP-binding protein [Rhizobium sp. Root73]
MAELTTKTRPTGATAVLARHGFPQVTSATGGEIQIVTGPSQPGFNPIDLLYASLSACLTMSARIAASQMGLLDRLTEIRADVSGEKATEGLSRVAKFNVVLTIEGDIHDEARHAIAQAAEEEICTVSNTLRGGSEFSMTVRG